ncbi:hypothetical protein, variant [Exophiala oligosperma]|uniref:C2H2-type domain-containing protein n=1 Tax=Exophiala oligosperma TaxID=215243 RepID=A0A0D2DWN0_9EURO|nr:hypothetical protein, variant [Exophiala oligosperma]KIW39929.1 hypothetical protein, variant [Exophiala oligosperma]
MSNYQDPDQVYDLERDFLAPARSPVLQPVNINYRPVATPPPLVPNYPSSESSDDDDDDDDEGDDDETGGGGPSERRTIRKNPNQVELARLAEKNALASASEAEEEEEEGNNSQGETRPTRISIQHNPTQNNPLEQTDTVEEDQFNDEDGDFPMIDSPDIVHDVGHTSHPPMSRDTHDRDRQLRTQRSTPTDTIETATATAQCRQAALAKETLRLDLGDIKHDPNESLITSPALGKYAMTPRFPDPDVILPAIQKSPPRSSPASSPQHKQTLPSLRTHLGEFDANSPGFAGLSPIVGRPSPPGPLVSLGRPSPPFQHHQPTHSTMSPPALPGQFTWRAVTRDSSISSEYTPTSSGAVSTPASSVVPVQSPATSISVQNLVSRWDRESVSVSDTHSLDSSSAGGAAPESRRKSEDEQSLNGGGGLPALSRITADGLYQCLYQGCTAAPFQTQYLLNSHMNVHSDTRTHFCHVEGCPHGPGGKGFKRKNEMIRHGLVHDSPGYPCPFCPDQLHRYPRPDNLQRHVRAHHKDRDRDDPRLRQVLNQRAETGGRGRRRMRSSLI